MNLRQIEVFHAVYKAGSISAASRLLNVSQPSVSKVVKHAETRLGFSLFQLVRGRLVPTDEAHLLFRDVEDLHERIDIFQRTARNLRTSVEGCIRLGVLPSLALSVTPAAIARFRHIAPRVTFEVHAVHHDSFREALGSRECDIVIGHHLFRDPALASVPMGQGSVGVLFRRDALPEAGATVDLDMLRDKEVISFAPGVAIADLVGPAAYPFTAELRRSIVVRSVYIAAAMAREGAGIAIVDEFTARGFVSSDLCFRPLAPAVTFQLEALHLAEHPLSRVARGFLDAKRAMLSEPIAGIGEATPLP
ncbi:LysR family transcriptional regulator [Sphingomonas nostoxanthinifaciens]|uniref:LysR family transcriptional regulator n=1 Tax=Sphingomonas nostoxanthinifaciens TaxID=2872652 RepID=UPI001CC213ED|nr:LysR family transcriptional regulator [Sphingomonas nostoxanthinifaciens]UAK25042.1 LysR family transcriptional regulator [Sphingomonas nostoxanthinifaciens]